MLPDKNKQSGGGSQKKEEGKTEKKKKKKRLKRARRGARAAFGKGKKEHLGKTKDNTPIIGRKKISLAGLVRFPTAQARQKTL